MTSESAVQPPLEKCPSCCFPPVIGKGGQSGVAVASSCPRQFLEEWAAEGRQEWRGKQVKAFLESALTKAFEIQWVLLLLFNTAACLLCCFQCLHWPWREETRGKLERERELEYLPPNQSFISFLNDCMFIALPEAQYKVFWTSDELIKLNAVTPLLSGSVTSLPAPCLISASNFALCPTVKQFFLCNLAAPSYLSSLFLANARMSCLKFLFRPLLVYGIVQIPRWVCSRFTSDTIGFCWALGFKRQ